MNVLHEIRDGLSEALDAVGEGWRHVRERAGAALTRFTPGAQPGERDDRPAGTRWSLLAADVRDGEESVEVRLEVPGMEPGDFVLEVRDGFLVVSGEKHVQREETRGRYHVLERAYGRFRRAVPLPADVDDDAAKAEYRRGVLRVTLPKRHPDVVRRIRVNDG